MNVKFRAFYGGEMVNVGQLDFFEDGSITVNGELVGASIMQSTGIKDKNYKEIWEGDILSNGHYYYDVRFGNFSYSVGDTYSSAIGFYLVDKIDPEYFYSLSEFLEFDRKDYPVIGNVYENPELLK